VAAFKKSSPSEDADFVRLFQPGVDPIAWSGTTRSWLLKIYDLL
jgi:hypothetical protein